MQESEDLNDNLTELTDYISNNIGATGVYIGKLEHRYKAIEDDDDETAHIEEEAPLVLKFKHASKDHQFMIGKILNPEQGVCHDLFKPQEDAEAPEEPEDGAEVTPKVDDILTTYKHEFIDVKSLVTNNRLHFWKVPRLGCFMAVPLVYNSCLSESALDTAIANWGEVSKEIE